MMIAEPRDSTLEIPGALLDLLRDRDVVVLAGAGCSTESGIPDYRGPEGRLRTRSPVQYQDFVATEAARIRYWARSMVGWARFSAARPNRAHFALARLEAGGILRGVITQNVDGLHQAAGSRRVVELHGSLAQVRCLQCSTVVGRDEYQGRLRAVNESWREWLDVRMAGDELEIAPDGDAELPAWALENFRVPACERCGGVIKPDVVFFGESVPPARVQEAWEIFDEADTLLVVGSSLTVYSGRRFIYRAQKDGVPIGIINLGPTRADGFAAAKIEGPLGEILPRIAELLLPGAGRDSTGSIHPPSTSQGLHAG